FGDEGEECCVERAGLPRAEIMAQDTKRVGVACGAPGAGAFDPVLADGVVHVVALGRSEGDMQCEQEVVRLAGRDLHDRRMGTAKVPGARRLARPCLCVHWLPPLSAPFLGCRQMAHASQRSTHWSSGNRALMVAHLRLMYQRPVPAAGTSGLSAQAACRHL